MKYLKVYKVYESQVDKKVQLLKDLCVDLEDVGLFVEIWKEGKSIHLFIQDQKDNSDLSGDNYYEENLYDKEVIHEFDKTLKSYGMNYRSKKGGSDKIWYEFDKWGKMTKSDIIYPDSSRP